MSYYIPVYRKSGLSIRSAEPLLEGNTLPLVIIDVEGKKAFGIFL